MRYLPTLEIGQQFNQVAFPDMHAIELAEICLTLSGEEKIRRLRELLVSSPMLLFWLSEHWKLERREGTGGSPSGEGVVTQLVKRLIENAPRLVKDHFKPLTSISSIEVNAFVEIQGFFECRNEAGDSFSNRILNRLVILQHRFGVEDCEKGGKRSDHFLQVGFDEQVLSEFDKTDFSQMFDREEIERHWLLDLPAFRNGLGVLDDKIERLTKLETEFDDLVQRAKISAMQQLAYGASHDVNNPLANISTRAQALLRDEKDPKRRQRLLTIDAQAFRAHDMISNLMTFAKPRRPEMARFQLRPAVESAIEKLARTAEDQQVELRLECESAVYVEADPEQFGEIIYALVENAIESIRLDGTIRIRCQLPESGQPILVEIMDTGPGISPEIREHIFDPFFSGREAGRGLGFGLSKVWRLMELHHGSVRTNEKQNYTVFQLMFPASQDLSRALDVEKTA